MTPGTPVRFAGISPYCSHPEGHGEGPEVGTYIGTLAESPYPDHIMAVEIEGGAVVASRLDELIEVDVA